VYDDESEFRSGVAASDKRMWSLEPCKSFKEMCSGSEVGSYLRLIDFEYHSTLGFSVIKKKFTD